MLLNKFCSLNAKKNCALAEAIRPLIGFAFVLFFMSACSGGDKPNVELIQDMMDAPSVKSQEYDAASPDNRGMRTPPDNTVPRGFKPYAFKGKPEEAKNNQNPVSLSEGVLVEGQKYYAIHCAVCHGVKGDGQGSANVLANMALKPPSLLSEKIRTWTDGQIYHVIHDGQGVMGPYNTHIVSESARWSVVHYIRHLQNGAK